MKLYIPNSAFLGNINTFFSNLDLRESDRLEITTNSKWIAIHPLVLAIIAALGKSVHPKNITCDKINAQSGHYLKRMGLFTFIGIDPVVKEIQEHEPAGRFVPLTCVKNSDDLDIFLKELVPLLHLEENPEQVQSIQHIFSELIRNVIEHSSSPTGAIVCAQYFKKSNKISIGVVDRGIGLKKSLQQYHRVLDDVGAIKLALTPGITGTTARPGGTAQNAGFGLFLIKSIAFVNKDFFNIISGDRMYKLLQRKKENLTLHGDPYADRHTLLEIPHWDGVAVGIDISLNQTIEFTLLLETIHKFYSKEVRGQKKAKYKKPRFI